MTRITRRDALIWAGGAIASTRLLPARATSAADISPQPYFAGVSRALDALQKLGAPVASADAQRIGALVRQSDSTAVEAAEQILDRYTLARLLIDPDGTGRIAIGGAPRTLVEQGWRMFLVRIANPGERTGDLSFASESQGPGSMMSSTSAPRAHKGDRLDKGPLIEKMWLLSQLYVASPIILGDQAVKAVQLSGIPIEYCVLQLFSRGSGHRSDKFTLYMARNPTPHFYDAAHRELDFDCLPSRIVTLAVLDERAIIEAVRERKVPVTARRSRTALGRTEPVDRQGTAFSR